LLGVLTETRPDHLPNVYGKTIEHGDLVLDFSVDPDGETMEETLKLAAYVVAEKKSWIVKATRDVSSGLLAEYNESWADGLVLDEDAFVRHIKITSVGILGTACLTIMFDDGELFGGHALVVNYFDLTQNLKSDLALAGSASIFG